MTVTACVLMVDRKDGATGRLHCMAGPPTMKPLVAKLPGGPFTKIGIGLS